jgi:ferredoxin
MQDDVALLKTQLLLSFGRTADARKCADSMNLDNPARKEVRALAASIVAEAWARTGKSKDALALLDSIEVPKQNAEAAMDAVACIGCGACVAACPHASAALCTGASPSATSGWRTWSRRWTRSRSGTAHGTASARRPVPSGSVSTSSLG